jgi:8-amino-7-oxononanoate synthase
LEKFLVDYHKADAALVFNSGYDANVGFFSSVPQRGDIIFYDELVHASIRDGIQMSHAKAFKFAHNNLDDLFKVIERNRNRDGKGEMYVVTESVFSMDGDSPDLKSMAALCREFSSYLVVDEAHATGIFGHGRDKISELGLEEQVFARLITFGKAMGCHGAAILGSESLKQYLINFARSFIYTTALPPHTVASILGSYFYLQENNNALSSQLFGNIDFFKKETQRLQISEHFVVSDSAIQCAIVPGNEHVKAIANQLKIAGFDVKPILSPTVNEGKERLRFCLHVFNKKEDISQVLTLLKKNLESGL